MGIKKRGRTVKLSNKERRTFKRGMAEKTERKRQTTL